MVWCDLILERHVFEVHGRIKFVTPDAGGIAPEPRQALFGEKQRQDFICGFHLGMSGIYWSDFWGPQRAQAQARLTREFLQSRARFGSGRADLEQFRPRVPRRRSSWHQAA